MHDTVQLSKDDDSGSVGVTVQMEALRLREPSGCEYLRGIGQVSFDATCG
jgi:hypothetical protein